MVQEIELQAKRDQFRLDELRQQHLLETRQVPKKLKAEHKQVISELRKGRQKKNAETFKEELKRVSRCQRVSRVCCVCLVCVVCVTCVVCMCDVWVAASGGGAVPETYTNGGGANE